MLYSWPLTVWENMMWVRGMRGVSGPSPYLSRRGAGRGLVRTSGRGVSLIPTTMWAGWRVG